MTTIFIADDSEPVLHVLRTFFAGDSRFRILGEARNYADTLRLVGELRPDIVLADVRMPGAINRATGLSQLVAVRGCPVIAMSFSADAESQSLATKAGAARLLDKTRLYQDLIPAIDELLARRSAYFEWRAIQIPAKINHAGIPMYKIGSNDSTTLPFSLRCFSFFSESI